MVDEATNGGPIAWRRHVEAYLDRLSDSIASLRVEIQAQGERIQQLSARLDRIEGAP